MKDEIYDIDKQQRGKFEEHISKTEDVQIIENIEENFNDEK